MLSNNKNPLKIFVLIAVLSLGVLYLLNYFNINLKQIRLASKNQIRYEHVEPQQTNLLLKDYNKVLFHTTSHTVTVKYHYYVKGILETEETLVSLGFTDSTNFEGELSWAELFNDEAQEIRLKLDANGANSTASFKLADIIQQDSEQLSMGSMTNKTLNESIKSTQTVILQQWAYDPSQVTLTEDKANQDTLKQNEQVVQLSISFT